ncbi:hypothetical protein JYZ08_004646 [Salmonella enterica subsp. enterica serovar Saintpaul]|nr:hypothetical protein [Salmonella enterica subsp. enterica serovar Saintpaul]
MKSREFELLKKECDHIDDWSNGIFLALFDLLMVLSRENPEVLKQLEPRWKKNYDEYMRAEANNHIGQNARRLEARKMLYGMLNSFGAFGKPPQQ